ncbi:MAG TPA: ribonuclease III [Aggregatilineales bacterium]|nr:ribonuclease III [Aggregatilineales bacterium]
MDLQALQARLGMRFEDENMLMQALTHRSYSNDKGGNIPHYERLEFLGDAVLDFISADFLYTHFPHVAEGELTQLRSALVKTEALAHLARMYGLGDYIRMSKGDDKAGGRTRDSLLCDVFEALIGVMYLQKGLDATKAFMTPLLTAREMIISDEAVNKSPRSRFQEWAEATYAMTPRFEVLSQGGQSHLPTYEVAVYLGERLITTGHGTSKRIAAKNAAQNALMMVESNHPNLAVIPSAGGDGQKPDGE